MQLSLSLSLSFRAIVQCGNSSLLQKQRSGRMMRVVVVVVDVVGRVVREAREAAKRKVQNFFLLFFQNEVNFIHFSLFPFKIENIFSEERKR